MAERPLYTLYKNLKAQNYDVPDDYNKFESALTRDGKGGADNRHAIYENLKAQNFDVPNTYERFYSALFVPRSKTSSRAKGGSVPMSAADRARFSAGAAAISASAQHAMNNAGRYNRLKQRKQKQQKDFGRVNLGTHQTPYGGDANNVVKDDFAYNPETGKAGAYVSSDNENVYSQPEAEQKQAVIDQQNNAYQEAVDTGEIPSVFDVRDKSGNYDLQENINKNGTYLTEEGARNQFDKKLADAYARKKEIEALIAEDHRQHGNPLLSYGASIGASNGRTAEQSDYSNKLATSLALVKQQIGALEAVKQYPTSSWGEDALKALDNTAFTAKTWDFGLTDFATMGQMERIKTKMDNNLPLSGSDKMLLKSKLGADAAAALEDEKMGNIYRWTKIAGQSLPFMADFFLTGGYGGITKAISRGALKFAAKRGMGKVSAAILKNTGIVAGDVIGSYAMAGTEQALKTGADIMQRHLGNLYQDEKGDYKFGTFDENGNLLHEGGESMGTALYKGLTSAMVENYTEKLFGHSYGIKKGAINFMEKHGMNASAEFFKNIGKNRFYTDLKKWMGKFGYNGYFEEVMEEEIGIPLHALLDGDNKFSDLLDTKQQLDIIGGMALSVGSMYAMGAGSRPVKGVYNRAQYYRFRNKVNVADSDAQNLMGDKWADIKDKIDNTTNEQMGSVMADILRQRDTMSKDQINAAINYGINLMKMRGYNVAKTAEMNAREITNEPTTPEEQHQEDIDNAYSEGHDADDADKHDIQLEHKDQMKTLAGLLNISEQQLSAMNDDELQSLTGQNDKLDQAIYDYQLSSARYQGVTDDAQDKIDMSANQAAQRVDMYTDKSRGSVRNATVKASGGAEDYGVYIISGNIATNEDGSINVADSDDMILFYDPTTNSVEHADALRFAELGDEVPADDVKAQAVADAKEKAIKEVAGIVDGTIDVGSQFKVTGADGLEHTYEILADYGDGTAAISIDGNVVANPYSLEDLQQMKDMEDQKRLEAAKAQREQMEKERAEQTQETELPEETQPSLDFNQILNDNGNVVLVDVLDKDGNTKYPDSKLFLIRDTGAKAKVVEMKSDGTFVPHAVSKKNVATISSMSLDEYKQAMAETSMIEENSGAIEGDRGGIEVNDELPPVPDNVTINGDGTYSVDGAVQGGENTTAPAEQTEQTPAMTLEDGTIVPMLEDGNPDFSKLTADQTAELYDSQFGEDADSVISGWVSDAKKALDKANNMTVKGKNFVEQKAAKEAKEKAIADAQAAYDSAIAIRDAYNSRQLAKVEDTAEGRKNLIEKARRKFSRLKSAVKDDAEAVSQLYKDVVGSLLHRLYDGTGIDVTDTIPLTAEEYVASNLGAHSLNYEGTEKSKGVKQETGLSREDFAKTQLLAADGKGTTIDDLVHSLWENRPSNLESLDTQDIRNALIGVLNSGFKASEARNYIENLRIAQAENILEEQKKAADNATFAEQQTTPAEQQTETAPESEEKTGEENSDEINDEENEKINEQTNENINATEVPEDATDENPLGQQKSEEDLPFSARDNGTQQTTSERAADVEKNKVDDMKVVDNIVGEKTRKAFERLAKMMGANIQWQYSDKLGNGWIQETKDADGNVHRTIFITLDSSITEGAQFIFGHEMTHQIKSLNPAAYNELTQLVIDTYGSDAFDKAIDETMRRYSDAGFSGRARDYYAEEVVADAVGEMIRDLNLAHTLAMKMSHPLLAAIHEILQKIKLAFFGTEYSDVTKNIIRSIEQAYVKTAKGEVTNSETGEDVSFSLRLKSAIEETETNPSDAQKESGNYKKGHIKFGGYDYTIENPKGLTRSGKDADGKEWKVTMHDTYGYIRGKFGKDGDHLDMFINDKADLDNWNGDVFVVDQVNPDGSFDEHKVMYGYDSMDDAENAYRANYSKGWKGLGSITGVSKDEFDKWLDTSNRKLKPFVDYVNVKASQVHYVSEPRFSLKKDGMRSLLDVDGKPVVVREENGNVDLNYRTWQDEKELVRDALVTDAGLEEDEADAMIAQADVVADAMKSYMDKYPRFRDYQYAPAGNREIIRDNGDYLSWDYSFNCIKKDAMNAVMDKLVSLGKSSHLGVTQVEAIKKILQKHKFLTPCVMCYVEGKRKVLKQSKADAQKWNSVREYAGLENKEMGEPTELTDEQQTALKNLSNGKAHIDGIDDYSVQKIANLMLDNDILRGNLNYEWMMSPSSFTQMYNKFGNTDLMKYMTLGQYRGKQLLEATPFSINNIPRELYLKMYSALELKERGGLRQFSYEDARAMMFFDYYTQFLLMQGARSPEHLYTKRPFMPEMFGKTGAMINQSLIVDVWGGDKWHQDALGLSDSEYDSWLRENAGFIPRGALPADNADYKEGSTELVPAWSVESFPLDKAMENIHNRDFKGNVGNTIVAPSHKFILWALDNPDIHMILAYHAAGGSPIMKTLSGYDKATAMDGGYHTLGTDGKAIKTIDDKLTGVEISGGALQWNRLLRKNGYDAKKAAQTYLDFCKENGFTPMFNYEGVVDHPNYYKMLTDFRVYDEDGKSIRQKGVKVVLPDNWQEILNKYLEQEQTSSEQVSKVTLDENIMKEIDAATKFTSIELEERDSIMSLLQKIYGKGNVEVLGQNEFDASLDGVTNDGRAQMLRDMGGMVYGYAAGNRIVLNEYVFNANTPLHEHAHLYMKVLSAFNPRLYQRGMELWRDTPQWNDAKSDIERLGEEPTDDRVFSECMAQFTGTANEDIISKVTGVTDKNWIQKALEWMKEMWDGVKSAFKRWTKGDLDALTANDFAHLPLRAFYDTEERNAYIKNVKALNDAGGFDGSIRFSLKSMMEKPEGWKQANKKAIHIAEAIERDPKFSLKNLDGTLIKAGTYFSGGGLVEEGLKGIIDPVVAVEYDEKISGVYRNNFGQHIVTADVRDVDPKELVKQIDGEVEYFHASPVCKNYSQAKSNHTEVELDKETAASTAEFINAVKPKVVTIENVKGYKDSEAMKIITDALDANGYTWDADVYNAADYGGYTNRERLIVRAVRDGKLPAKPKKMAHKSGWYEAVEDIIPTLTEKKNGVAPWMDIRLKADGIDWRNIDKPLYVMGSAYADGKIPHAFADELLPTLRTKSGDVIVMPDGKVYRAMGRVLARVSGVSDDYKMPFSENLSHTIIGNGIPTQLTEHVIAPLLTGSDPKFSIRTYHGTGASFDKFDFSHMGEGEGSQAFGWGGYVTNSKDIAEDYTRRAKIRKDNGGFEFVTDMSANNKDMVRQYIYKHKDVNKGLDAMRKDLSSALEMFPDDDDLKELSDILAKKNEEIAVPDNIAYLYDVDIPDDNGDYLDWDAPLTDKQKNTIIKELRRLKIDFADFKKRGFSFDGSFGGNAYDFLMYALRKTKKWKDVNASRAVSKFLSSIGFTGIKYKAGTIFGGAKEGDTNYVIFDENNANIVGNTRFSLRYDQFEHDLNQWKKDNNLPKDAQRPTIPQRNAGESVVDFLRRVDEYRKMMALWKTAPTYEQHLLSDDTALGEFNRELQRGSVLKRIAFQDSMLAIRKAQEAIMKEVGVDRLNMAEDAYTAENRSHGKGKNEFEEYNNEFLQPLRKAYHQMKKVLGDSYDNVRVYMMAKHGLERDAQMAFKKSLEADYEDVNQRSAAYKAYKNDLDRVSNDADLEFGRVDFTTWRQKDNALRGKYSPSYMDYRYDDNGIAYDYSGLSSLFDGSDFEEAAHRLVRDVETKHLAEVQALWNATNAATKKILRDGFKAGMMSKDAYEYVKGMYSHYIPLRGWDGTTADQVWDYIGGGKGAFNQTLKTAHGRTSIADDPIAYIENMAESGILLNNKNWVKQHLMLLAQNHPTSLLTLSKAWYVKSTDANGNEEWIPATPQITSQMNSNQVKAAIDAFEQKMEQMAQTGDATQQRDGLNIAYPQTHSEEREHEVRVMKDGEEYVIYVNGDPQLAQAMNNTRAHRVREIQSGKLDRAAAWLGRKMAAAYTSLSPLFIPSNYFRDLTMTLASTAIREDGRYNYLLRKNLATSWNLGFMLRDYQNGKLREKVSNGNATPKEQMFYDFMMNGGETGFVSSLDVEDLKKKFKNDLKDLDRWKANPVKVGHTVMDAIEFLNRAIEDSNRFAVYMTSIQYGRSIDEAVNDAKDVTLNFNRKGTGEYGWQMIRNLYLFINPAVQSLQTLGALTKHHPFKFTAVTAAWLTSGVLVPIVNAALMSLLGGDDDKDKYWQFSKWDRRNNLIMWVPFTNEYVKIPLAQEFRAFYGIGDMIASKMMGGELAEETWSQYAEDLLGQVVDMLPLDPTGYDGNIAVSLMPNPIRPVFELAFNVDFTGKPLFKDTEYNKYDPNFTKAYVGTPDWLVRVSKMVNSIGNDYPDVQQNAIDAFGDPRYNLNNPAVVDHVLSSYLGGAYTMGSQVLGVLTKSLNDQKEIKMADIPLVSKFVSNPDDRPVTKKQGDEFWNMKENHDRAANTLSKLKKQAKVDGDYSMLERFYGSEEYKQYKQDDVKVKKYEEDKKKERAEESGEDYRPHKLNAEDIYKAHATPKDDFEDLKLKQLFTKLNGFKTSYDLLVDTAPGQSDGYYNTNKAAIDAIDEISLDKQEISELKKGFLEDGKDAYNAEDMKRIRELRKRILSVLEPANKVVVANQKAKAEKK